VAATRKGGAPEAPVSAVDLSICRIPTDAAESDGTLEWDHTTLVIVEIEAGGKRGLGYTYADAATGAVVNDTLRGVVLGQDVFGLPLLAARMAQAVRNLGRQGVAAMAVSAVDCALWDLKARLLDIPLVTLLGQSRAAVRAYGSGGFTSYDNTRLAKQLGDWAAEGFTSVKMKVGRDAAADPMRVRTARRAVGNDTELFVDANGAYAQKQALALALVFAEQDVRWFEEPVSSDDLTGLRLLRDRAPARMEIAAGEYGYDGSYFRRMMEAQAVDVLQADATRCGGVSGFVTAHALCDARNMPLSAHCAPALHVHLGCALPRVRHLEYFHDHQRIERMLFDGAAVPRAGSLAPELGRPGFGLEFKRKDAARFLV